MNITAEDIEVLQEMEAGKWTKASHIGGLPVRTIARLWPRLMEMGLVERSEPQDGVARQRWWYRVTEAGLQAVAEAQAQQQAIWAAQKAHSHD